MFDKYQVISELGQGSFCRVYLVRHISLEQERVMKCYPRSSTGTAANLMEARILRDLVHPGIPMIYDLEEDDDYFYVIEEYIRGENLFEFLQHQPFISEEYFFRFSLQLCDIFSYLHGRSNAPLLYRDLKPEHLILDGTFVRLVDFNISSFAASSDNNLDHFGNLSFSAPESFSQSTITFASDIYSIGKLLEYLSAYLEKKPTRNLRKIIRRALQPDPSLRFETVEALSAALLAAQKNKNPTHLEQTIAIVGSHHGCGATHLAIALVSTLNFYGISAVCYEENQSDSLRKTAEAMKQVREQDGCYRYCFFTGMPSYGPAVMLPSQNSTVRVIDCGNDPSSLPEDCDLVLLIATGAIWRRSCLIEWNAILREKELPVKIIGNLCTAQQAMQLAVCMGQRVYHYPIHADPFCIDRKSMRLFRHLLGIKRGIRRPKQCCFQENEPDRRLRPISESQVSDTTQGPQQ